VRRTRRCAIGLLAILAVVATIVGGCGSGGNGASTGAPTTVLAPMELGSGAFAVVTVPEGWAMYGAYAGERLPEQENDFRGVLYKSVVDPENLETQWQITSGRTDPEEWANNAALAAGVTRIDVNGHEGYIGEYPWDNDLTRTTVAWLERPDRWVRVDLPSNIGLDVRALASNVHELSAAEYAACHEQCHVTAG